MTKMGKAGVSNSNFKRVLTPPKNIFYILIIFIQASQDCSGIRDRKPGHKLGLSLVLKGIMQLLPFPN